MRLMMAIEVEGGSCLAPIQPAAESRISEVWAAPPATGLPKTELRFSPILSPARGGP